MSDKAPPPQVWPTVRARDARALIRFLVEAFGFEETVVYGEGAARDRLRIPGLRRARPGGQPLVVRHVPGRAPRWRLAGIVPVGLHGRIDQLLVT